MTFEEQIAIAIENAPTPEMADRLRDMLEREKNATPGAIPVRSDEDA